MQLRHACYPGGALHTKALAFWCKSASGKGGSLLMMRCTVTLPAASATTVTSTIAPDNITYCTVL